MKVAAAIRRLELEAVRLGLLGVTVENDSAGDEVRLQVCAPVGRRWVDGPSCLVVSTYRGEQSWLDDAVEDARARMSFGLRDAHEDELDDDELDELERIASGDAEREERHGRYLDSGPGAWDDRPEYERELPGDEP